MDFVVRLVPLYFVLIVQELFIFTKVNKFSPSKTVDEGSGNLLESIDFKTRVLFQKHKIAGGLKKNKKHTGSKRINFISS